MSQRKILKGLSKKVSKASGASRNVSTAALKEQYHVIRDDLMKLRKDLEKGYDLAKGAAGDKKGLLNQLIRSR